MKDLSLHILDIAENSLRAGATLIKITVGEHIASNWLTLEISDNGKGMSEEMRRTVTNPFVTTRTLRKVGLGLPLLAQRCELCEGDLQIISEEGKGTTVKAKMRYGHIDRVPLGDMGSTLMALIMTHPTTHYIYTYDYEQWDEEEGAQNIKSFIMDTEEIKQILGDVAIENTQVLLWLKEYVNSNMALLCEKSN